jgi:FkbM family methyltransferase
MNWKKKLNTLLHINLLWAVKFLSKRAHYWFAYQFALLRGVSHYSAIVDGVEIKLAFHTPYHHMSARECSRDDIERNLLLAWKNFDAKVIYDIGGMDGIYGLIAAKVHPESQITIFEPDKVNFAHIEENIRINNLQNCTVMLAAVSDFDGTVRFTQGGTSGETISKDRGEEIRCVSLASLPPADLIKLDVEGAEARVISALPQKAVILLEEHTEFLKRQGDTVESLWCEVRKKGLRAWYLGPRAGQKHYLLFP